MHCAEYGALPVRVDVLRETFARIAGRLQAGMPGLFVRARG